MKRLLVVFACTSIICTSETSDIRPQTLGRAIQEGQITVVYVAPRFATAIRMPEPVNSVVLGDPDSFSAEHSEREPQLVVVKPVTILPARTNLLISTAHGHNANVLLISRGEEAGSDRNVDFLLRYRPAGRFLIEPGMQAASALVAPQVIAVDGDSNDSRRTKISAVAVPVAGKTEAIEPRIPSEDTKALDLLLERQRRAPLPPLYGAKPGIAAPAHEFLKAGVSEVIDQGREVVVLFSVINMQDHAVEIMPPQVQLAGTARKGKIFRRSVWANSEQLPVTDFRMSRRRIGPQERADGVLVFNRPSFKQSNETLLLQIADSGAVDRPSLAPIGFGIDSLRDEGAKRQ